MSRRLVVKGHAMVPYKLVPLISVNGGSMVGRAACECGAVSPILRGNAARTKWHSEHKESVLNAANRVGGPQ